MSKYWCCHHIVLLSLLWSIPFPFQWICKQQSEILMFFEAKCEYIYIVSTHVNCFLSEVDIDGKIVNEIILRFLSNEFAIRVFIIVTFLYRMYLPSDFIVLINYPNMKIASQSKKISRSYFYLICLPCDELWNVNFFVLIPTRAKKYFWEYWFICFWRDWLFAWRESDFLMRVRH
jgi:hypothetical protein